MMSLALLDAVFFNVYVIAVAFGLLLIGSAYITYKKNGFYNHDSDTMSNHRLNTVYGFDKKKKLNFEEINHTYFKTHLVVAVTATLIMFIGSGFGLDDNIALSIGFVTYFVLTIVGNSYTMKQIAEKYEHTK